MSNLSFPLLEKTVVVTRAQEQQGEAKSLLIQKGITTLKELL